MSTEHPTKPTAGLSRVFINYAREDGTVADRLYSVLAQYAQIEPWLDRRRLRPGDDWQEAIRCALEASDYILVLMSSRSVNKKGFVQREIREALEHALLLPPGHLYVIPVRLDECHSPHPQLQRLQYVDLFPEWSAGVSRLCDVFGIRPFTHQYVAFGSSKNHTCALRPLSEVIIEEHQGITLVNVEALPKIDDTRVPTERMRREGQARDIFLKLWTVASSHWSRELYRKSDWNDLDHFLFNVERTEENKRQIVAIVVRQWALARELKPYDEDDWRALRGLIQTPRYGSLADTAAPP